MLDVFAELFVEGGGDQDPTALIDAAAQDLPVGWRRDTDAESRIRSDASAGERPTFVFSKALPEGGQALVFLLYQDHHFKVTNIVPRGRLSRLDRPQYNDILSDFSERVIGPSARRLGYNCRLTDTALAIDHWLGPRAAQALKIFSSAANKGTGSAHPFDFERWSAFIILAHAEVSNLNASTLERWLVEEENWPSEVAADLGIEYEFGRQLLKAYERSQ